jgi:type I restriction enzyme S subunit
VIRTKSHWLPVKLGDHVDILTGFPFKSENYSKNSSGIRLVRGDNVAQGSLRWDGVKKWNLGKDDDFSKYELQLNDVILAMDRPWIEAGLKYAWITSQDVPSLLVQRVARMRGIGGLDTKYLRYVIASPAFTDYIKPIVTGVAVPHISADQIKTFKFDLPPLPIQRRIADILSAYDDLIENNARRIRILEQMAQAIYQMMFGKGNKKSLPTGWKISLLQDVAEVIDCLHSKKPIHTEDGVGIFLQLNNIGENGKLDLSQKFLLSEEDYEIWTSRIEVTEGDCVITNVGRVAAVAQIPVSVKAALGRNMTAIRPKLITPTFLIESLLSPQMMDEFHNKKDSGVIMDALNVRGIIKLELPLPPMSLLQEFEKIARPIRRRIEIMVKQNANLRQTRDLLLPRLVSGEIDVSSLS